MGVGTQELSTTKHNFHSKQCTPSSYTIATSILQKLVNWGHIIHCTFGYLIASLGPKPRLFLPWLQWKPVTLTLVGIVVVLKRVLRRALLTHLLTLRWLGDTSLELVITRVGSWLGDVVHTLPTGWCYPDSHQGCYPKEEFVETGIFYEDAGLHDHSGEAWDWDSLQGQILQWGGGACHCQLWETKRQSMHQALVAECCEGPGGWLEPQWGPFIHHAFLLHCQVSPS